jgi:hypothetical protein
VFECHSHKDQTQTVSALRALDKTCSPCHVRRFSAIAVFIAFVHPQFELAGCAHKLADVVDPIEFKGMQFVMESGGTGGHMYRTKHPMSRSGHAIVKVFCMPFGSRNQHGKVSKKPGCSQRSNQVCASLLGEMRAPRHGISDVC